MTTHGLLLNTILEALLTALSVLVTALLLSAAVAGRDGP